MFPIQLLGKAGNLVARLHRITILSGLALTLLVSQQWVAAESPPDGAQLYQKLCVECHGGHGQGAADQAVEPLHGDLSVAALAEAIADTMPEQEPDLCTGEEAAAVASYIFDEFYSAEAWTRLHPSQVELTHLTVRQYRNSVADLLDRSTDAVEIGEQRGLRAHYYDTRRFRGDTQLMKIDSRVSFDFGEGTPNPVFTKAEEFSIRWQGSVLAADTGEYEFVVETENGAKLWVNDNEIPLIDAWVSSAGQSKEHRGRIQLLGGRAYPIRLDVFKYKESTASVSLSWKPPHQTMHVIPERHLIPTRVEPTFVVNTAFPPDDNVSGYERGVAISEAWDRATTTAALETVAGVVVRLDDLTGSRANSADRVERVRGYCRQFAERAFRRPLSDEELHFFVETHFEQAADVTSAVKRSLLLILKSPRFLYPTIPRSEFDDYDTAARLALGLWDSLPDQILQEAAASAKLNTREQVATQATRMLSDPRTAAKLRYFFHQWLQIDEKEGLTKDKQLYPDFSAEVLSDLRTSLDLFLDDVVWSESSDFRQLLLADYLFLNQRSAAFLGETAPADDGFQRVSLNPNQRSGIVTHPFLLATFAYFNSSSPVHRGVFVTRRLLGRSLKPPPQAIEFKDGGFDDSMTTRQKLALQTDPPACQACHATINPLGFSLEHYDAVGRFRQTEQQKPINAQSIYTTVKGERVALGGARGLAEFLANSDRSHGAFVDQIFHQAVKHPINAFGPTVREDLINAFVESEYNIKQLLVEVMKTAALQPRLP